MRDSDVGIDDEAVQDPIFPEELATAKREIEARCKAVGFTFEETALPGVERGVKIGVKCARDVRNVYLTVTRFIEFASIPFEKYAFLPEYNAICSYQDGYIEAAFRPSTSGLIPSSFTLRRLFGDGQGEELDLQSAKLSLEPPQKGFPSIELSAASKVFKCFLRRSLRQLTFKLSGCSVTTNDEACSLLKKIAGAAFFQIDLMTDVSLTLERERRGLFGARRQRKRVDLAAELQYPKTEFDEAPLSLYGYGRSASGMPLLQFLAFYQVLEFYFPIYSQAEAQRKVKGILKDPTFRGDRDADIGRLLSSIRVTRTGAYGDERSQLRATLTECIDPGAIREFLESDLERKEFYVAKAKSYAYHRIPLANPTADLRNDVADRVYDIRCKIVHTKNDSGDGEVKLLLPFSGEAEQLSFDIELVQFLAQRVLVAGSLSFQPKG